MKENIKELFNRTEVIQIAFSDQKGNKQEICKRNIAEKFLEYLKTK